MNDRYDPRHALGEEAPPPRPAFVRRLWMILVQPGELFKALADNPAWFPMAAFTAATVGIVLGLTPAEVFYETAASNTSPEQLGDLQAVPMIWYKLPVAVFGTGVVLFMPVILSLVTYVIFVFMRGDRATFRQHLCVMSHAGVITAVGAVLLAPLRIRNLDFEATVSVGSFFPFLDGFLLDVLNGLDLFALWGSVVAGLGLSLLDPRRRWVPTAVVLVALVVVLAVARAFFMP